MDLTAQMNAKLPRKAPCVSATGEECGARARLAVECTLHGQPWFTCVEMANATLTDAIIDQLTASAAKAFIRAQQRHTEAA